MPTSPYEQPRALCGASRLEPGMRETHPRSFKLRGDDFDERAIETWFREEAAFFDAFTGGRNSEYPFFYHYYNWIFGMAKLLRPGVRVLDFGCAEGLTLTRVPFPVDYHGVDASTSLLDYAKSRHPEATFKPIGKGQRIPYEDAEFELIFCFGVLHHIPNVSFVLREFNRVLEPGGLALIREPITDMCKLDGSRESSLSANERGLHPSYFASLDPSIGLCLERTELCFLGPVNKLRRFVHDNDFLMKGLIRLDRALSRSFAAERLPYRRRTLASKLAPTAAYFTLRRPLSGCATE